MKVSDITHAGIIANLTINNSSSNILLMTELEHNSELPPESMIAEQQERGRLRLLSVVFGSAGVGFSIITGIGLGKQLAAGHPEAFFTDVTAPAVVLAVMCGAAAGWTFVNSREVTQN
jgi:hypothetical protein